jgi:hypothetical protein
MVKAKARTIHRFVGNGDIGRGANADAMDAAIKV